MAAWQRRMWPWGAAVDITWLALEAPQPWPPGRVEITWIALEAPQASPSALLAYWNGSVWSDKPLKRWSGASWAGGVVKRWNGSAWVAHTESEEGINYLEPSGNTDTSTIEGSDGAWASWFTSAVARSTAEAHTGAASLAITAGGQFWGVSFDNWPGFVASPGPGLIRIWAKKAAGTTATYMKVAVLWRKADGSLVREDDLIFEAASSTALTTSWQMLSANVTIPALTERVYFEISGNDAVNGDVIHIDDIYAGTRTE